MNGVKETIGRCEGFCGRVDHHLVDGLCPDCRARSVDHVPRKPLDVAAHDQPTEYDEQLGFEAYVGPMEVRGELHTLDAKFRSKR